jgi:hypothetical protein
MRSLATDMPTVQTEPTHEPADEQIEFRRSSPIVEWLPLVFLPLIVLLTRNDLQPWVFMWLLAAAIFAGCKWLSFYAARGAARQAGWKRSVAFLFLWPGMNAREFLSTTAVATRVTLREWSVAVAKTMFGAALIWIVVRRVPEPLLAAWVGMLGLILLLHFGIFHLLSAAWRSAGVCAEPIMQKPLQSRSLSEFWGKRWNLGFRQLSYAWIFKPLRKKGGVALATLCAFLASGLIHDLVISVPARGGYGLPTAYFMIQGIGVLVERSPFGTRLGLAKGIAGWTWMALFTAGPAYWLFHPWFAMRVMLPFLRAIGAAC